MSGRSGNARRAIGWCAAVLAAASLAGGAALALDRWAREAQPAGGAGERWFCPAKSLGSPAPGTPVRSACSAGVVHRTAGVSGAWR